VTDGQTELRWLRRAIAVPAVARKNKTGLKVPRAYSLSLQFMKRADNSIDCLTDGCVDQPLDIVAVGCESSLIRRLLCYGASISPRHVHHSTAGGSPLTASLVTDKHGAAAAAASVFVEDEFFTVSLLVDCDIVDSLLNHALRARSHEHECESEYPYTGSNKHEFACISH